ncbi:MAG TPA: hypothetical protein VJ385_08390 [Fibrobacteria bacterium]|nr:hypothetical protein [Fibrobacteria bacterium]
MRLFRHSAFPPAAAILVLAASIRTSRAEDLASPDENALFADTVQVVDSVSRARPPAEEHKSLGISGSILAYGSGSADREYHREFDAAHSSVSAGVVGNAALDARLLRGFRAYADFEWSLDASRGDSAVFRVPETFLDANIGRKIWFRAGKQVLQWGPGYFFNPTDLINVERKTLVRRIGEREGVHGAKVHVPFGTAVNLYGFLDAERGSRPDSLSGAVRAEFLADRSEIALMAWDGGGRDPVYGADLSTRWLGLDFAAEGALYSTFRSQGLEMENGFPGLTGSKRDWQPRASLGVGRGFRVSGIPDRLMLNAEYYYNHPGSDARRMPFAELPGQAAAAGIGPEQVAASAAAYGAYEPNSFSRHYAAFFGAWHRFLRSDLALSCNAVANLNQGSALLAGVISYRDLNDFGLSFTVFGFAGPAGTEYTFAGQALQAQLLAEIPF